MAVQKLKSRTAFRDLTSATPAREWPAVYVIISALLDKVVSSYFSHFSQWVTSATTAATHLISESASTRVVLSSMMTPPALLHARQRCRVKRSYIMMALSPQHIAQMTMTTPPPHTAFS